MALDFIYVILLLNKDMSTEIKYNGVNLGFIRTISVEQEAIREPSDSDYLYTKISIKVNSVLNRDIIPPADAGGNEPPVTTAKNMRAKLMTDCATLVFSVGGIEWFRSPVQKEDVKHGPKPLYCNILRIDGNSTMHIEFAIETYIYDENCADSDNPYVSNRWKEIHLINEHAMTKRTISGKVFFRGNFIDDKKINNKPNPNTPDTYRGTLIPPNLAIPQGFKRMSMEFTVPEDGLGLEYTIIDEEQYTNPPRGLTKFEAEYSATTTKGAVFSDKVIARGWSDVLESKANILNTLVTLCVQVFDTQKLVDGIKSPVWSGGWTYKLHENWVEVQITRLNSGKVKTLKSLNLNTLENLTNLDYLAGTREMQAPNIGLRGTANIGMVALDNYLMQCVPAGSKQLEAPKTT